MKFALISPLELREEGYRIAQVSEEVFDIAEPFYWTECPDEIIADIYYYRPDVNEYVLTPIPEVPESEIPVTILDGEK